MMTYQRIQPIALRSKLIVCLFFLILFLGNCTKQTEPLCDVICIPEGFPLMHFPDSNFYTKERWLLGKKLFYEKRLSIDHSVSCASCHLAQYFFADNKLISPGVQNRLGTRNAPSLGNIGYHPYFLKEGGVPSLEMQVLVPIQDHNEFNHNIVDIAQELATDSIYSSMSLKAYNRQVDAYVITRAMSTFERTLITGNSPYDKYTYQNNKAALSERAINGMNLFFGNKANCSSCHNGFNFTDYSFKNNGLYTNYGDVGRMILTNDSVDLALFKVPSLRNVGQTAPYMHDGSIQTLEEVIEHYNQGGYSHMNKSALVHPLNLTTQEKENIILFLRSLTDWDFANNSNFYE